MTLALTGKSRRRQFSLILAAVLALTGAIFAGIAARDAAPAAADQAPYTFQVFGIEDYADPPGVLRPGEITYINVGLTLAQDPGPEGFSIVGDLSAAGWLSLFEPDGLANDLSCSRSPDGFACSSNGAAEPGLYRFAILVRSQAACVDGPVQFTFSIDHPADPEGPRTFTSDAVEVDCSLPEVAGAEINIVVQPWSGPADSTLFRVVLETPPTEPSERDVLAGETAAFAVTPGGEQGSLATLVLPAGGWTVHSVECWGFGDAFSMAANELQFYLKYGYVMSCTFFVERPQVLIDMCYEGEVGALASGARWGFFAEGIVASMAVLENSMLPGHPDHPVPFELADFVAKSGQGWQWSSPVAWDPDRDFPLNWRLQIEGLPLVGAIIDAPDEARVTPYNLCPGQPLTASFNVCSHFLPDDAATLETFDFTYIVNGELAAEMDVMEGETGCAVVQMGLNDLDVVVNMSQVTQPEWQSRAGYPTRAIAYQYDPPQAATQGSEIAFRFHWVDSLNAFGCHEVGQLPAADFRCAIDFYNARPLSEVGEVLPLVICSYSKDETGLTAPAVFGYRVHGELVPSVNIDSSGGAQYCFTVYVEVPDLTQPILVEQLTPGSWAQATGWPKRRVIHYQDNPQANRPGGSVLVQFATGKGGELVCYEPGIEGFASFDPLPGTGLACHVVFENVRAEPPATATPTATATTTTATPTTTATVTSTPEAPTATATSAPATQTASATVTAPPPAGQSSETPAVPSTPGQPSGPTTPNTNGGTPPVTTQPSSPGNGQTPVAEETVAGEQAPGGSPTPIAPSTGESAELAGTHASVWAVMACFLFAASIGFTTLALWRKDRER